MVAEISRGELVRVLLVSANPKVQAHFRDCFKESLYRLAILPRWQDDLEVANVGHYKLIVLDLSTDRRQALDLFRNLRSDTDTAHLPIIGIGNEGSGDLRHSALSAGFNAFLSWEAKINEVLSCIDAHLNNRPRVEGPSQKTVDQQVSVVTEAVASETVASKPGADETVVKETNVNDGLQKHLAALLPYQAFFENASDGFFITDRRGEVLFVNKSGAIMLGLEPNGVIRRSLPDLVDQHASKTLRDALNEAGKERARTDFDLRVVRPNGVEALLSIHIGSSPVDQDLVLLSSRDVTEERHIVHEYRRTKQFFESLIDSSTDAIISADLKGTVLLFNKGAERLLGYQASEVIGTMNISRFYPPDGAREVKRLLHQDHESGVGRLTASRRDILTKSGELVPILLTAWCVVEDGKEVATAGIFTDLRERLRIEHKLSQAQEKLMVTEKQAMIAELAGATAHELNQPLTSVLGYAELAKRKLSASPEAQHILDVILSETERIATIVRKLGGITRYETKSYVGEQRIVDLDRSSEPE